MSNEFDRRNFIKLGSTVGAGLALGSTLNLAGCTPQLSTEPGMIDPPKLGTKTIRVGFVGLGARGSYLYGVVQSFENVEVTAVCDIDPKKTEWAINQVDSPGGGGPC